MDAREKNVCASDNSQVKATKNINIKNYLAPAITLVPNKPASSRNY